jgi:hypothetical protein
VFLQALLVQLPSYLLSSCQATYAVRVDGSSPVLAPFSPWILFYYQTYVHVSVSNYYYVKRKDPRSSVLSKCKGPNGILCRHQGYTVGVLACRAVSPIGKGPNNSIYLYYVLTYIKPRRPVNTWNSGTCTYGLCSTSY